MTPEEFVKRGMAAQTAANKIIEERNAHMLTPPLGAMLEEMRDEKDEAYRQRNCLVAALARLFPSGTRKTNIEDWDPEWHGCVYIDLPTGQISYHYHDSQAPLFGDLPPYTMEWDGHDKETVHRRLEELNVEMLVDRLVIETE